MPGDVKNERSDRLEQAAERISEEFRLRHRGRAERVLVEKISGVFAEGYTGNYIKVYIDCRNSGDCEAASGCGPEPGEFCDVIIGELFRDGCKARLSL